MALTIRKVDEIRGLLDWFKASHDIKTDSGALSGALRAYHESTFTVAELQADCDQWRKRAEDAERLLAGLEQYLAPALENIRQQELDI